jgi:hypothetical protein
MRNSTDRLYTPYDDTEMEATRQRLLSAVQNRDWFAILSERELVRREMREAGMPVPEDPPISAEDQRKVDRAVAIIREFLAEQEAGEADPLAVGEGLESLPA